MRSRIKIVLGTACVAAAWSVAGACAGLGSGCSKPLLSPEEPRSPFDRYDAVRSQHATQYTEDKFGRRQPNLRARLEPKN